GRAMSRPSFKPTAEQREMVKSMAAIGLTHEQMAVAIGIRSPKTVRKHFRKQLNAGNAEAIARVTSVAYEMAQSGKYPSMTWSWLRMHPSTSKDDVFAGGELERSEMTTEEQRRKVKALAGFGVRQKD